ncbi:MAG: 3-oxoacyl-ACP synthase III family protein [Candidatus Cryptobacteroides sp.]|jgi:3-oxoacyl-[acyl-carrier-protein] synthase-3
MSFFQFRNIRVGGVACAVPKNVVTSESFKPLFGDEEVEKFIQMTGIKASHRTSEHQTCSDLGFRAARELLAHKGIDPSEIGAVIFSSHSPDYRRPATAFVLQYRLGIPKESVCFDMSLGCSSLVVGMQTIASIMNSGEIKKGLLFVGDTAGKSVYPEDRSSAMLFGEAGAVMLLEKTENKADRIEALIRSDGSGYRYMIVPGGGYRNLHASEEVVMCEDNNPRTLMNSFIQGTSVFTFTVFDVPRLIKDFFEKTETGPEDYDCFAFHQANLYILKQIAKKTRINFDRLPISLDRYGNTSGASAIVSLCDRYGFDDGHKTLNVMAAGFGIGISLGVTSFELNTNDILPVFEDDAVFEEGLITNPNQLYDINKIK